MKTHAVSGIDAAMSICAFRDPSPSGPAGTGQLVRLTGEARHR